MCGEKWLVILPTNGGFHAIWRDMLHACWGFFRPEKSDGFYPQTTEAAKRLLTQGLESFDTLRSALSGHVITSPCSSEQSDLRPQVFSSYFSDRRITLYSGPLQSFALFFLYFCLRISLFICYLLSFSSLHSLLLSSLFVTLSFLIIWFLWLLDPIKIDIAYTTFLYPFLYRWCLSMCFQSQWNWIVIRFSSRNSFICHCNAFPLSKSKAYLLLRV
jgi:hypothetical protein